MRARLLARLAALSLEHPYSVVAVALFGCILSVAVLPSLQVSSSRFELSDDDTQRRIEAFLAEFGSRNDLVALVTSDDEEMGRAAADQLADRLERELPEVRSVFHRVPPDLLRGRELLLMPTSELVTVTAGLAEWAATADPEPGGVGLASLLDKATLELGRAGTGLAVAGADVGADAGAEEEALIPREEPADPALQLWERREALLFLVAIIGNLDRWLADPTVTELRLGSDRAERPTDTAGYLVSRDGRTRFAFVSPRESTDRFDYVEPLTAAARRIGSEVALGHPGVSIGFTGYPAVAADEIQAIRSGSVTTGVLAAILVLVLFAVSFRSFAAISVTAVALMVGICWALGAVVITVGGFNLLTQVAAPCLAGLGIDFAVHLLTAYDHELGAGKGHDAAVHAAMTSAGKGNLTGGLTTAGAFLAMQISEYQAFAELGIVAGVGLLLVLTSTLTVAPALLTIARRRGWRWMQLRGSRPLEPADSVSFRERFTVAITARPGWAVATGVVATLLLGLGAARVRFDADVHALLPADAESVVLATRMVEGSSFSSEYLASVAADLDTLRARAAALRALPNVARVESVADFVPDHAEEKLALLAHLPRLLPGPLGDASPPGLATTRADLAALAVAAESARFEARGAGHAEVEEALGSLAAHAQAAAARLGTLPDAGGRLVAFDQQLIAAMAQLRALLAEARSGAGALTPSDIPDNMRRRFVSDTPAGGTRYALYVYPEGYLWSGDALSRFIDAVYSVDAAAVGYPIVFRSFLDGMTRSVAKAAGLAALLVLLLLSLDFRSFRDVFLAMSPLALASIWLFGLMGWLGIDANLANVAALPLVLGIGVDDGVHLIHRVRAEGSVRVALPRLLPALVLTTATTIAGFGTIGLAAHRGMKSFALVLILGAACCLLATLLVLPAMIRLTGRAHPTGGG